MYWSYRERGADHDCRWPIRWELSHHVRRSESSATPAASRARLLLSAQTLVRGRRPRKGPNGALTQRTGARRTGRPSCKARASSCTYWHMSQKSSRWLGSVQYPRRPAWADLRRSGLRRACRRRNRLLPGAAGASAAIGAGVGVTRRVAQRSRAYNYYLSPVHDALTPLLEREPFANAAIPSVMCGSPT
jgi:hypothetical protein